jgi:hypothetical protein
MSPMRCLVRRHVRQRTVVASMTLLLVATLCGASAGAAANRPYFSVARNLWLSEAEMVSGALQNVPLVAAAHDLQLGLSTPGGDVQGYAGAIATIRSFERIPLTSETSAQVRASHRDWSLLNTFFELTPTEASILDNGFPSGSLYNAAQRAWMHEPAGAHDGVNYPLLKSIVTILRQARSARPQRAIIYQAALVDAQSLESASASDIAVSASTLLNTYSQDVYYLNVFLQGSQL